MRLCIEDDSGAAWYVQENLESLDLTKGEDREILVKEICDTIEQMKIELDDYNKIAEDVDPVTEGDPEWVSTDEIDLIDPLDDAIKLSDYDDPIDELDKEVDFDENDL